ncbi:hypothetical protein ACS0TY_019119 [Phlomoides rotata]
MTFPRENTTGSEKVYLKRMRPDNSNLQNRGTTGKSIGKLRVNDTLSDFLVCRTHDHVLYFSGKGVTGPWLLFISESGHGKRVPLASFRTSPLNRVGLIGYKFSSEDRLAAVFVVGLSVGDDGGSDEQVSQNGTVNWIKVRHISTQSLYASVI